MPGLHLPRLANNWASSQSVKVTELRTDCALFSQLYIVCQSCDGDLDEFFRHENQPYPPSLSQHGSLRLGTKSDLLTCFSSLCENSVDISTLTVDTYILEGAVIVQCFNRFAVRHF